MGMLNLDWKDMFTTMHPGFFEQANIRAIDPEDIHSEMILDLKTYQPLPPLHTPESVRYEVYDGDRAKLYQAVRQVIPEWITIYETIGDPVLCGMQDDRILSFCILENMKSYKGLRIGGPGCVGTVPEARRLGVGLRMVQLATEHFQREGYDISYIHYTGVAPWYAKLGYQTILTWNRDGFIE